MSIFIALLLKFAFLIVIYGIARLLAIVIVSMIPSGKVKTFLLQRAE